MLNGIKKRIDPALAVIFLTSLAVRLINSISQSPVIDDAQMAFTARNFIERGQMGPTTPFHPELRNIMLYFSSKFLGYSALSLRGWSIIGGSLLVLAVGIIALKLFKSKPAAYIASGILCLDGLNVMYSRNPYQSVPGAALTFGGILLWLVYRERKEAWALLLSGLCFGLGAATIWQALFPLAVCVAFSLWETGRGPGECRERAAEAVFLASALLVLPLAVYMLTFLPWFARGYGMGDWLRLQQTMYSGVTSNLANMANWVTDSNRAHEWFLRPVSNTSFGISTGGKPFIYSGISNPLVWMAVLPAMLYMVNSGVRKRARENMLVVGFFLISYLPFAFAQRNIFSHSAIFVLPFGALAIGKLMADFLQERRGLVITYLGAAAIVSLYLLPMALGFGMDLGYLAWLIDLIKPG